jgi:hypothetical protein
MLETVRAEEGDADDNNKNYGRYNCIGNNYYVTGKTFFSSTRPHRNPLPVVRSETEYCKTKRRNKGGTTARCRT